MSDNSIYVEIPLDIILNPDIFQVDENNIISHEDYNKLFIFDFFNNESILRKLLKIKIINAAEESNNLVKLDISVKKVNNICKYYDLPITFEYKTQNM